MLARGEREVLGVLQPERVKWSCSGRDGARGMHLISEAVILDNIKRRAQ